MVETIPACQGHDVWYFFAPLIGCLPSEIHISGTNDTSDVQKDEQKSHCTEAELKRLKSCG
jgi:hypothetical protein